jgi:hypothetical protein
VISEGKFTMTKPTPANTDANSAITTASDIIDRQAGGAGEQAKRHDPNSTER